MRVPIRKAGKYTYIKQDPFITPEKLVELKASLEKLKKEVHPQLASEVKRLALMGDFSENAAYQIAKGRLRGLNEKISKIEKQVASAQLIDTKSKADSIQIGSLITIESNKNQKQYRILGSLETDPAKGVISYSSPLGQALIDKKLGDSVEIKLGDKAVIYKIIKIE
jgi:transcription elongation factor GreA